jgi:hydroxypyruvate reductase
MIPAIPSPVGFLTSLFDAAVKAADPSPGIAAHLPEKPKGKTIVVGAFEPGPTGTNVNDFRAILIL